MERPVLELPAERESAGVHPPALPCANCGTLLAGPYCFRCGQHVADYHRSVWRFVVDFLDNTFSWDSRFLRTLGPLFQQPGFLTQEFMAGRRVRYVHPLRLFLFTSAVCLALLHFGGDGKIKVNTRKPRKDKPAPAAVAGSQKASSSESSRDNDDDEDASSVVPGHSPAPVSPAPAVSSASPAASPGASPVGPDDIHGLSDVIHQAIAGKLDDAKAEQVSEKIGAALEKKMAAAGGVEKFSRQVTDGIQHRLSWVALAMLPIFAMMLRAVYWSKETFYFQHLVFSLHYHTFLLMFWTAYSWLGAILRHVPVVSSLAILFLLVLPAYLFLALQRVYGGSARRTFTKTSILAGLHLLAIISGLAAIGALSFFSAV